MEVQGKRGQETGPKAEKDNTERATGLGRRTREEIYIIYIENWDQTDSPDIPDKGEGGVCRRHLDADIMSTRADWFNHLSHADMHF